MLPVFDHLEEMRQILRPIPQGRRVEVGVIRPDEGVEVWVDPESSEEIRIAKRLVNSAVKHGGEINGLSAAVVELQSQGKWGDLLTRSDTNYGVWEHC